MKKHGSPDGRTASPWFAKSSQHKRKKAKAAKKARKRNR